PARRQAARPHRGRRLRSLLEASRGGRARIEGRTRRRSRRPRDQRRGGRLLTRRLCPRGQPAARALQAIGRRRDGRRRRGAARGAPRPLRRIARAGRAPPGHRADPRRGAGARRREGRGGRRAGAPHVLPGDPARSQAPRRHDPGEPRAAPHEARVHGRGRRGPGRMAAGTRFIARPARGTSAVVSPRPTALLLLALALGACATPSWVPGLGRKKDEAKAPLVAAAPREAEPPTVEKAVEPRPPALLDASVTDRVIAVVNNDAITLAELQEAIAVYRHENQQAPEPTDELVQQFLRRMIESRLQLQEAERDKIVVDEPEVEEELAERIKKVNVKSREEFERLIKAQGLTLEAVKRRMRDGIKVSRLIRRKVTARVSVTDAEIAKYLEANRQKLETGLSYHARHILLVPEGAD